MKDIIMEQSARDWMSGILLLRDDVTRYVIEEIFLMLFYCILMIFTFVSVSRAIFTSSKYTRRMVKDDGVCWVRNEVSISCYPNIDVSPYDSLVIWETMVRLRDRFPISKDKVGVDCRVLLKCLWCGKDVSSNTSVYWMKELTFEGYIIEIYKSELKVYIV